MALLDFYIAFPVYDVATLRNIKVSKITLVPLKHLASCVNLRLRKLGLIEHMLPYTSHIMWLKFLLFLSKSRFKLIR